MPTAKAKVIPIKRITSWSFSRWDTWRQCAARAKYKFIDKLKEPEAKPDSPLIRGMDIHNYARGYVIGRIKMLPVELKLFKQEFKNLKRDKALAEMDTAFTTEWDACSSTDWDNAWVRVKLDAVVPPTKKNHFTVNIIDYKTGRLKEEDYRPQMELYGLSGLLKFPQAEAAEADLWFIDEGVIRGAHNTERGHDNDLYRYPRKDLEALKKKWEMRVRPMLSATSFPPTPNPGCRWCAFAKDMGGPCKFNSR